MSNEQGTPGGNQQPANQGWGQPAQQQGWSQPNQPSQGWSQPPQPQGWGQPAQQAPQAQGWAQPQPPQAPQQPPVPPVYPHQNVNGQANAFPGGQQQAWNQPSGATGTAPSWEQLQQQGNYQIPPEYPAATFKPETFSIPAFFLGGIWYFVKGMWQKGLILFVAGWVLPWFISFGTIISLVAHVFAGLYGLRDYLRYYNSKQQFWW